MNQLRLGWYGLSLHVGGETDTFVESVRKYYPGLSFELDGLPTFDLADMGYSKMKQRGLERNYFDPASIEVAMKKAHSRKKKAITSVAFSFSAEAKRAESQGHCMQTGVFSFGRKHETTLDMFYRSTEVTKKFGADLLFIRDVIVPAMNWHTDIKTIRFHFALCYFSLHFFPVLEAYKTGAALEFLEHLRIRMDKRYWMEAVKRLPWFFDDRFISKMSMIRAVHTFVVDRPQLRDNLEDYYSANISKLPRGAQGSTPRP